MAQADVSSVAKGEVMGYAAQTVSSTALGFTAAEIAVPSNVGTVKPSKAEFKVETDAIRFTRDGKTTPTASVGILAAVDDIVTVEGIENIQNFQMIRVTTDATINVSYTR